MLVCSSNGVFTISNTGSKGLPLVGNVPRMIRAVEQRRRGEGSVQRLFSHYGPICKLRMLGKDISPC